jgi:hypothetical protein
MAQDRTVTGAGFQLVIKSGSLSKSVEAQVMAGLKEVSDQYKKELIKTISLKDHSLQELREMGYPYSTQKAEGNLHGDDRLVHEQTGELKQSIQVTPVEETTTRRFSVFATSDSPHMPFLIFGTSRMRPRRFHERALENIKDKFWKPVTKRLKNVEYAVRTSERE